MIHRRSKRFGRLTRRSHRWPGVRRLRDRRGQAFVEAALVMSFLSLMSVGVVEFGRAFMIANVMTHALRDGARQAAVVPRTQRDANGLITNQTPIRDRVKSIMSSVLPSSTVNGMSISVTQPTENGINLVRVSVDATIPYTFRLIGNSFRVQRSVSFRDEGR